ncbi:MAG TPA: hypothetical protein VE420_16810, partial [Gemmatimonadales bacterium]|nr:hypothetical protein [Gemmatimonadales bacterium]
LLQSVVDPRFLVILPPESPRGARAALMPIYVYGAPRCLVPCCAVGDPCIYRVLLGSASH